MDSAHDMEPALHRHSAGKRSTLSLPLSLSCTRTHLMHVHTHSCTCTHYHAHTHSLASLSLYLVGVGVGVDALREVLGAEDRMEHLLAGEGVAVDVVRTCALLAALLEVGGGGGGVLLRCAVQPIEPDGRLAPLAVVALDLRGG